MPPHANTGNLASSDDVDQIWWGLDEVPVDGFLGGERGAVGLAYDTGVVSAAAHSGWPRKLRSASTSIPGPILPNRWRNRSCSPIVMPAIAAVNTACVPHSASATVG